MFFCAILAIWCRIAFAMEKISFAWVNVFTCSPSLRVRQVRLVRPLILTTYRYKPDDALAAMIYPNPKTARERAEYLARMQCNVFGKS